MSIENIIDRCAKELAMDSAHIPAIKSVLTPYFTQSTAAQSAKIREMEADLEFIKSQSCTNTPDSSGVVTPCTETDMCVTEYCWPCYATKRLEYYKSLTSSPQNGEKGEK